MVKITTFVKIYCRSKISYVYKFISCHTFYSPIKFPLVKIPLVKNSKPTPTFKSACIPLDSTFPLKKEWIFFFFSLYIFFPFTFLLFAPTYFSDLISMLASLSPGKKLLRPSEPTTIHQSLRLCADRQLKSINYKSSLRDISSTMGSLLLLLPGYPTTRAGTPNR